MVYVYYGLLLVFLANLKTVFWYDMCQNSLFSMGSWKLSNSTKPLGLMKFKQFY